jgi:predicted nucleotidyltransferase
MKPSIALDAHREEIRRIVAANRGLNPRVFGSVLHQEDTEESDLDLLIDAADGLTLFDMATIALAIESLVHTKVDVRTPEDLSIKIRQKIVAEALPV